MPDDIEIDWPALEHKIANGLTVDYATVVALYHLAKAHAPQAAAVEPASEATPAASKHDATPAAAAAGRRYTPVPEAAPMQTAYKPSAAHAAPVKKK